MIALTRLLALCFQVSALEPYAALLCVTSTTGDGEAPESSAPFFRALRRHASEGKRLPNLRYALLGAFLVLARLCGKRVLECTFVHVLRLCLF